MELSVYNKFWIAVIFLLANVARSHYGIDFGMNGEIAANLVQGIGAAFVWLIPNKAS